MPSKGPVRYLNRAQVAERLGIAASSLSRAVLPDPDVIVGPVNEDGSLPKGTVRGWLETTINEWKRPGQGARTDLHP
ncbi:hypothetical protein ACFXHA_45140 [Nocardia sp. NPDC059240]|uniref:hypothetical protein n=1 Tax=Nocardia sp. NPDC059240 TaxID=3346786 RepID=UPI00367BC504